MINAVGFDASHFQPKVLLEKDNGSFTLEVREQPANIPGDTNWLLQSTPSESTLAEYIDYQDTVEPLDGSAPKLKPSSGKQGNLKFGCDLDLSDSRRWAKQLREIAKLEQCATLNADQKAKVAKKQVYVRRMQQVDG